VLSAISFAITINDRKMGFRLPCDWRPVYAILTKGKKTHTGMKHESADGLATGKCRPSALRGAGSFG